MAETLKGIAAAAGIAIGKASIQPSGDRLGFEGVPASAEEELARLESALRNARSELRAILEKVAARTGEKEASLFRSHILLLEDPLLITPVRSLILQGRASCEEAVRRTVLLLEQRFQALDDGRWRERAADIRDVGRRLTRCLGRGSGGENPPAGILVAHDLTPSEAALLDPREVAAIVTEEGGATGHTAILARALNIVMVAGVRNALARVVTGDLVVVDGSRGEVVIDPDEATLGLYRHRLDAAAEVREWIAAARHLPASTLDGYRLEVTANIGVPEEIEAALSAGAEGVGLFRTEFLFLRRDAPPSEDEQFEAYRAVLAGMSPRPVVIRTLDAGGDKEIPGWQTGPEPNPALGLRGIRLCLEREPLFAVQLRALLRAAGLGNLSILLPMVCDLEEVRRTKRIISAIDPGAGVRLGVMVETPAAALLAEELAAEVDFFSIGTNDLAQYVMAADRANTRVAGLCRPFHPAVLRLIRHVCDVARRKGRPVGLCGEMAADPLAVPLHVGLGLNSLSLAPASIPRIKDLVRRLRRSEASALAGTLLDLGCAGDVQQRLAEFQATLDGDPCSPGP